MKIDDSLLMMAGFTFAHAVWNVSDLLEGELLAPLTIVEKAGEMQLIRFEAETQEEAIAKGKKSLAQHEAEFDSWVFAREGQVNERGVYGDVLTIEVKLTRFRGHPILMDEGVRYAYTEASVPGGVPPTDDRTGPGRPHAVTARA